MNKQILITDIFWDRIYLHIKLEGENLSLKEFAIATNKNAFLFPVKFNSKNSSIIINITNIQDRKMLENNIWYIKYKNTNFEHEMVQYENDIQQYNQKLINNPNISIEKPWIPLEWNNIPIDISLGYKLKELDKIYRYSGSAYAYIISFSATKRRNDIICSINTTFMMKNSKPHKRYFHIETHSIKKQLKKRLIYFLEKFNNLIYQIISHIYPKRGKRILFMSETRVPIGGNLKVLDSRIKERQLDKNFKISYHFNKTLEHKRFFIFFIWLKLAFLTAKQDYIFVDDFAPFFKYINLHPKTKLIQVWHAGVGFKSVGYARFGEKGSPYPYDTPHRKNSYAIVGGEALKEVYAEVFGINEEDCLPYGVLRIDGYMNNEKINNFKNHFYSTYPQFKTKKIILFAPTFRGTGQRTAYYPYNELDLDKIYNLCNDEYVFVVKMHPFIRENILIDEKYKDKIFDFTSYPDINELFYVTDILITDYSSNIYEFSLQKKPIIFFAFDQNEYELLRSLHRKLDEHAPGKVCHTFDEVISTIQNQDFKLDKLTEFINENFELNSGLSSDRIIDNILLKKK